MADIPFTRYSTDYTTAAKNESESRELDLGVPFYSASTVITVLAMLGAGVMLTFFQIMRIKESFIFWITLGLFAFFCLTGPVAILLVGTRAAAVAFLVPLLHIGWHVFSPIRFWHIFHQFFPISIRWSHLIVSANVLVVGIVEWILVILVKQAPDTLKPTPLSEGVYFALFALNAVAGIGWFIGLFILKNYRNRTNGELSSVKEAYVNTELIEKFERKQKVLTMILFFALILPAVSIPIMKEFTSLGWRRMTGNAISLEYNLVNLRPDLVISLLVVVIVEILLQLLRKIRNELNDLVLIVISHIINIIVILLFMSLFRRTLFTRKLMGETRSANLVVHTSVMYPLSLDVGNYIKGKHLENLDIFVVDDVRDDGTVHVVIRFEGEEEVIYEEDVKLEVHRCTRADKLLYINFYIFRIAGKGYQFTRHNLSFANTSSTHPVFINAIPKCWNFDKELAISAGYDLNLTVGVWSEQSGRCFPMTWWFFPFPIEGEPDDEKLKYPDVRPTEYYTYYQPDIVNDCDPKWEKEGDGWGCRPVLLVLKYLNIYYQEKFPEDYKSIINPVFGFFAPEKPFSFNLIGLKFPYYTGPGTYDLPKGSYLNLTLPDTLPETELLTVMAVYGVSIGTAWVGYIHFIWIQSPIRYRFLVIFIFFTLMYISSMTSRFALSNFNEDSTKPVLALAAICTIWQILTTMLFAARWSVHHRKDPPQEPWPRY